MNGIYGPLRNETGNRTRQLIYGLLLFIFAFACGRVQAEEQAPPVKMPDKPAYVGSEMCGGRCHDPWYQAWKDSPHAHTYELLKPGVKAAVKIRAHLDPKADYTADARCLWCHTTGYGEKAGFVPGKTLISAAKPNLEEVGCEMCHTDRGGAQARVIMKKTDGSFKRADIEAWGMRYDYENVCRRCHGNAKSTHPQRGVNFKAELKHVHEYQKYYNDFNKNQTYKIDHGKGVTEAHPLEIEDWDIVKGNIYFKKLPLWEGWLIFKRK